MDDGRKYIRSGGKAQAGLKNAELLFEKEERSAKSFHLGIAEKTTGKVVGDICVYHIENDCMASVAIRVSPTCQRKEYGTESLSTMTGFCFENTELKRLWTEVDIRNRIVQNA